MAVFRQLAVYDGYSVGVKVKIALMGLIYRKILRLSSSYHHDVTPGYRSMECKTIERACRHVTWCIMVPVHLVIVTALSWQYVGWLSLVGSGLFVVLLISQGISRKVASTLSRRVAEYSANRVATVRQVVTGIRSVKMLAWESPLMSLISDLRRRELRYIRLRFLLTCYNHVTSICSSPLVSLVIFPAYAILGNELVAANVFATVALYSSLNITTANTSSFASIFTETLVAAQKLQMFLESEEFQGALQLNRDAATTKSSDKVEYFINPAFQLEKTSSTDVKLISFKSLEEKEERRKLCVPLQATLDKNRFKPKVVMKNACYGSLAKSVLSDITLKLKGSRLIGITGPCGSGKSSLLLAILNEMSLISGEAVVQGETVYVPQVPWVYAGTLRDNVLFGAPYDETRYWSVINACALSDDIVALPNGDLTTIGGSGGVSLSIGQQSRVSLARAAYRMSDIYLFDEPFCAISDSTSTHFMSKCVCGFLSSSLRILVTRHSDYLKKADHVVMLEDGRIANQGSFTELKHSILLSDVPKKAPEPSQSGQPRTLDDSTEENKSIHLSGGIYLRYLRNGGNPFFLAILLLLVLSGQSLLAICDWWLAYWTGMTYPRQRDLMYVHVLAGLLGGALVIAFVCFVGEQSLLSRASKVTHEKMVVALLKAPLLFFDTNTSESILKRFSRDVAITDEALPASLTKSLHGILSQSAVIILCVAVNYWVTLAAVPLLVVVVLLKRFAQRSFRDLRSLESSLRTPVNSHLVETARGLISIRAYRSQEYFSKSFYR
ncbi:ATP-binding cassette sub-family C member 4 isoform X2 [Nematostella vectensis]|nr:ATP-binding cassette sub-family C member 4 isoform X2 [Nematostella vectensis]